MAYLYIWYPGTLYAHPYAFNSVCIPEYDLQVCILQFLSFYKQLYCLDYPVLVFVVKNAYLLPIIGLYRYIACMHTIVLIQLYRNSYLVRTHTE